MRSLLWVSILRTVNERPMNSCSLHRLSLSLVGLILLTFSSPASTELLDNPKISIRDKAGKIHAYYAVGDVHYGGLNESAEMEIKGFSMESGRDMDKDGNLSGRVGTTYVSQSIQRGEWFRFSVRALVEPGFAVGGDELFQRVGFFGGEPETTMDHVVKRFYNRIQIERDDLGVNGLRKANGAAAWRTFGFDFRIPFEGVRKLALEVGFKNGKGKGSAGFLIQEFSLTRLPRQNAESAVTPFTLPAGVKESDLVRLGGRWFFHPQNKGQIGKGMLRGKRFSGAQLDRFYYRTAGWERPFFGHSSVVLKEGFLSQEGNRVSRDQDVMGLVIEIDTNHLVVHSRNLPDHPTATFPGYLGNPNYIQEQRHAWRLPLDPEKARNPRHMDSKNQNRALKMGPIGVAVNGVVFFNPFDAGSEEAVDIMDRCCGHPGPGNEYHYHKYPLCVRSPFDDDGNQHSPVIGWAFDGFPIFGPYESKGVLAKSDRTNPLNAFNIHRDDKRGWHYHVTPGSFPYIIGGYWGEAQVRRGPGGPPGGRGPQGGPPPRGPRR